MSRATDQHFLKNEQYQNASKLNARIALHQRFGTAKVPWHRWVFDQLELTPKARVLELGCGPGQLWAQNLDRLPEGWTVTLSDLSAGMVAQARQSLKDVTPIFAFVQADAQAIPFADGAFDAVIANHMLYHVPNREKAYSEVKRVLKPGGRLYAATNGRDSMAELRALERAVGVTGMTDFMASPDFFDLEHGGGELAAWFPHVALRRLEEELRVTEAQPLVDYLLSTADGAAFTPEALDGLRATVEGEITANAAFRVGKVSGLFVAERG